MPNINIVDPLDKLSRPNPDIFNINKIAPHIIVIIIPTNMATPNPFKFIT